MLDMVVEACLSMPIMKESDSTENFWGIQHISEHLSGDSEGKAVHMNLGRGMCLGIIFVNMDGGPYYLGGKV